MQADKITEENIVLFFNKYKYNSDQIFHLERRLLNESYDFNTWQEMLAENSKITRAHYAENEQLLDEFIRPAINNPELLSENAIHTFLLHITFFLFENNIDFLLTDTLVNAILSKCKKLKDVDRFEGLINLGISKTVTMYSDYEEANKYFDEALKIYPDFSKTPNEDINIHLIFCRIFKMLCMGLYKIPDYAEFLQFEKESENLLRSGTSTLYKKMWGENADFQFHVDLLCRYFRVYGIFLAGQCSFSLSNNDSSQQKSSLEEIISWLKDEYSKETEEGTVNPMIHTFYYKQKFLAGELSESEFFDVLYKNFENLSKKSPQIYPEPSFPIDDDPVDPVFANMLDKMKIFNWSFSLANILIPELLKISCGKEKNLHKKLTEKLLTYYESGIYAEKGFQTDLFTFENIRAVANTMQTENEFISFVQTIFVHREITSAIHFSMVSSLAGICLSHLIEHNAELFITEDFKTAEEVRKNRTKLLQFIRYAGFLHDIGKIGRTNLVNLHFRKITDEEFSRISEHTLLGEVLIKDIPYLQKYRDIIVGHHKYFDGSKGYPQNVDVTKSNYKIFVDLISICDTIDTSTDYQGRNYSKKKTFDDILIELKEMKTRYSPELVKIIDEDEALKEELRYMTTTGRNYTSYETYHQFIQPNTSFSAEDAKKACLFNTENKEQLLDFFKKLFPNNSEGEINIHIDNLTDGKNAIIYTIKNQKEKIFAILAGRIRFNLSKNENEFFVSEIIVLPEFRKKGWGTELINYASENLKTKNISRIKINIPSDYNTEGFFWIEGFTKIKHCTMEKEL